MRLPRPSDERPWESPARQGVNAWDKTMIALTIVLLLLLSLFGRLILDLL